MHLKIKNKIFGIDELEEFYRQLANLSHEIEKVIKKYSDYKKMGAEDADSNKNNVIYVRQKNKSFFVSFLSIAYFIISYDNRLRN